MSWSIGDTIPLKRCYVTALGVTILALSELMFCPNTGTSGKKKRQDFLKNNKYFFQGGNKVEKYRNLVVVFFDLWSFGYEESIYFNGCPAMKLCSCYEGAIFAFSVTTFPKINK